LRKAALLLLCLAAAPLFALDDPTYTALRAARPDGRTVDVSGFTFTRDVYTLRLDGTLHFLAPVEQRTFAAVFVGKGSYTLKAATENERRSLVLNTSDDALEVLEDSFDSAVFFAAELIAAAENHEGAAIKSGAADARAEDLFDDYMKKQRKDFRTNVHLRVMQELFNARLQPFFLTWVDGKKYPPALLVVDPLGIDAVGIGGNFGGEQTAMLVTDQERGGFWYASRVRSQIESGQLLMPRALADGEHYSVDTTINDKTEIDGITTLRFMAGPAVRVLPLALMGKLRISEASFAPAGDAPAWTPVAVIQEAHDADSDAAVVFPAPLTDGAKYLLQIKYKGKDVLDEAGDGNYTVNARTSWYPNVGVFSDLADFELTYRTPAKLQILSVGSELSTTTEGNQKIAKWKTSLPVRVAGFNYGKFRKLANADTDSGMTIEVFTNPGEPDIIKAINGMREAVEGSTAQQITVSTSSLAQAALADGINTARTGNFYFGALPEKRVIIAQQSQWFFGQSWPSLIYLPYISFLSSTARQSLGMFAATKDFVELVGPHEMAHQWWGHHVGWRSYRDQWLSEGFAEFTAALVLEQTSGVMKANSFWESTRKNIVEKPRGATIASYQAGPITQGWRVSTWRNPGAYSAITYSKGAYVLHMLRMTMQDRSKPNPDEAFIAMMHDFTTTYGGRNPSTRDFQRIVEKHATPSLKISSAGLDWFFKQWVHGTSIPKYTSKLDFQDLGNGRYKLTGNVTQSDVPADFAVVMPIYVHYDKTSFAKLGNIVLIGSQSKPIELEFPLAKKPQRFSINALHDVLSN
jgi:hypothetical protein